MKKIILILTVAICIGTQLKATDPVIGDKCCPVVVSTNDVNISYDEAVYSKHFAPAFFNKKTNSLHYESYETIKFVQIYSDNGEMKYQLPIMSNKVRLNKNMFDQGSYRVAFLLEGISQVMNTYVTIH